MSKNTEPAIVSLLNATVAPKPLRRFITLLFGVFAQAFFEKACDHAG